MLAPPTEQRRPKPPLTSMPSTPGPEVPGGYPRNSVVFAENKWDRKGGIMSYFPGAGSYFPDQPISSSQTSTPNASAPSTPSGNSYPLNTDGSVASNLSTRAVAGSSPAASSRGTLTPVPSDFQAVPGRESVSSASDWSQASAIGDTPTDSETEVTSAPTRQHDDESRQPAPPAALQTEAIPSVAPLAGLSAFAHIHAPTAGPKDNSKTTPTPIPASSLTGPRSNAPSTALSSPVSPVSVKSKSPDQPTTSTASSRLLGRFASVHRGPGHRKAASESTAPSAFGTGPRRGHPSAAAVLTDVELGDGVTLPSLPSSTSSGPSANAKPRRTHSLMRTLRGEAKVLAGKVTRDAGKVQEGKRMVREA
ncbi:hypothetical protein C8F01DRAFT_1193816 [Mycena amicta]|nr:hypothetical protein C8F01DRAFT_1193816 [Mycena amicta]